MIPIVIVGFNQPELTDLCISQVRKFSPESTIVLFDNSSVKSTPDVDIYLDNTSGKLIDFDNFLKGFPNKLNTNNNWGSAKHSKTIDYLFSLFPKGFIHMDCDFIALTDVTKIIDFDFATVGNKDDIIETRPWRSLERVHPALQFFNVEMLSKNGIKFFDPNRNFGLVPGRQYDTGQSFLQDIRDKNLPVKFINMNEYGVHLCGGTYYRKESDIKEFIKKFTNANNS